MRNVILRTIVGGMILCGLASWSEAAQKKGKGTPPANDGKNVQPSQGAQQQNLAKLKSDLEAVYKNSQFTPQMKQAVVQDLQLILATAQKPSQASVQALANEITKDLAAGQITTAETIQLTQAVAAVLSSANVSQQSAQKLLADVTTLLKATNLTQAEIQTLQQDVQAIVQTAQANQAKGTQPSKKAGK